EDVEEYDQQYAMLIANCMAEIKAKTTMYGSSYGQQYILQKKVGRSLKRPENLQLARNSINCTKEIFPCQWM
ncbi:MAG: hypothetical protein ACP5O7_13490, partial [Phycisphaerae bacterium]